MQTIIERKYKEPEEDWKAISLDQAIHDLESGGYWKKGTTKAMLLQGTQLWTPFALYRLKGSGKVLNGLGDPSAQLSTELRLEIKRHLDKCTSEACPTIYKLVRIREGYTQIEERIIRMVIRDQITPGAAISQIEAEL